MKKIGLLLFIAFLLISACMIYLLRSGVGLRAAPLIRPSIIGNNWDRVAFAVVSRLYPDFKNSDYVLWGVLPLETGDAELLERFEFEHEKVFGKKVQVLPWADSLGPSQAVLDRCPPPCWILGPRNSTNHLDSISRDLELRSTDPNSAASASSLQAFMSELQKQQKHYFTLSISRFRREMEIPPQCIDLKRLSYECLLPVVVKDSARKMRDPNEKYFFLRRYNDIDQFLLIEL